MIPARYFFYQSIRFVFALFVFAAPVLGDGFLPIQSKETQNIFVWTDTCNVYVIRHGDSALLIDLGDGTVLDHLDEIGVKQVEWVLFTHHHRLTGKLTANSREVRPLRLRAAPNAETGVHIVGLDVTLDGRRYGERFDCVVNIE